MCGENHDCFQILPQIRATRRYCDPHTHSQRAAEPQPEGTGAVLALLVHVKPRTRLRLAFPQTCASPREPPTSERSSADSVLAHVGMARFFKTDGIKDKRDRKIPSVWAFSSSDTKASGLGPQVDVQVALQLSHMGGFLLALCNGRGTGEGQQSHWLHLLGGIFIPPLATLDKAELTSASITSHF